MEKTLSSLLKRNKDIARNKNIREKAKTIAKYLGNGGELDNGYDREGRYGFKNKRFSISDLWIENFSNRFDRIQIRYDGHVVYQHKNSDITVYSQGIWENKLETLYKRALNSKAEKELANSFSKN